MTAASPPSPARAFASLVKLSHTVFGLPFALASAALAHRAAVAAGGTGLDAARLVLVVVAFAGARAAAMGFNRIVDARFDAANPRTANRELPRGVMSRREATIFVVLSSTAFMCAANLSRGLNSINSVPASTMIEWPGGR